MKNKIKKGHRFATDWQLDPPGSRFEFPWHGAAIILVVLVASTVLVWVGLSVIRPIISLGNFHDGGILQVSE